jgi:hypothetical protein
MFAHSLVMLFRAFWVTRDMMNLSTMFIAATIILFDFSSPMSIIVLVAIIDFGFGN